MKNKLNAFKKLVDKVVGKKAKDVSKMEFNKMNDYLDDIIKSTNEKIIETTDNIIKNDVSKVMENEVKDKIKQTVKEEVSDLKIPKNRRKGNRDIKEIPINNSTHQEQQLLLDAPTQKEPRKPRREYRSDLGTNTEPIELSGPTKNRRTGNRAAKTPTRQEQQLLLEVPKQKSPRQPRREYKSDLGVNTDPIQLSGPTKNRRRGNRSVKETPVDTSVQQSQQLLLDAPKQKSPRKPSREYKSDLGTNTEPIPLSGPVREEKKTLNFKKGEGTYTNPNKKRISENAEYNTKLIKKYHPTDPTYNLGIKTEGGLITKEKDYRLPKNDVQPESPVESAPQSKPEQKNKQVDVSIDDFKPADEIEFDDDNEIDVTHLFEKEEPKKVKSRAEEYTDKLEELETKYSNGDITDIEYAEEQQRLQDIFEKENPIDVSNVLSDQKEAPFSLNDFSMPNIDEVDINKSQ